MGTRVLQPRPHVLGPVSGLRPTVIEVSRPGLLFACTLMTV